MSDQVLDALVVGAGWGGLGVSYELKKAGLSHVVLERCLIGETWRSSRWDSFHLNTVNAQSVLPGDVYRGPDPEGFASRDEFVAYLVDYARRHCLPIRENEAVTSAEKALDGTFLVETSSRKLKAHNLIVASGALAVPKRPAFSRALPSELLQIDASCYRNPSVLPEGAVLVVGSAQSGAQIAEDLALGGRRVFLSTGHAGRMPRRYRGRDFLLWAVDAGLMDVRREDFADASGKMQARPLLGARHTLSLQSLSRMGVILLGRCAGTRADGRALHFADDLGENIRYGNESSDRFKAAIDAYIERAGLLAPAPETDPAEVMSAIGSEPAVRDLDMASDGISAIVWCTGFKGNYGFLRVSGALDDAGQPRHVAGAGIATGLFFPGLDFAVTRKSGTILSIAAEARNLVQTVRAMTISPNRADTAAVEAE